MIQSIRYRKMDTSRHFDLELLSYMDAQPAMLVSHTMRIDCNY